jgi:hypothetical protein
MSGTMFYAFCFKRGDDFDARRWPKFDARLKHVLRSLQHVPVGFSAGSSFEVRPGSVSKQSTVKIFGQ